ncbi:MAG: 6,7-dimethyl-8-ribityllumazine synthase [Latescibacteria bacterium DG_63]|nr:MAG: 6,7-dimethyl-8-ribityllumazine synthase [Latescibacteria bacterium DG_63]
MKPRVFKGHLDATGKRFALIVSRFNEFISQKLLEGALDCLERHGCEEKGVDVYYVPGSFEIPSVARRLAMRKQRTGYDAIISLGAVLRGDTPHFEFVASEVAKGIASVSLETGVPVILGVITADTLEQAIERAGTKAGNKGWDAAISAIEMASLFQMSK